MRVTSFCHIALLVAASSIAGSALAAYRCNSPATRFEKGACVAAQNGPDALRGYIQRVRKFESLYFFDYVNKQTALVWEENERRERAARQALKATQEELVRASSQ